MHDITQMTGTRHVPEGLTHIFTENVYKNQLVAVANLGIHCLIADYIGDYLIKVRILSCSTTGGGRGKLYVFFLEHLAILFNRLLSKASVSIADDTMPKRVGARTHSCFTPSVIVKGANFCPPSVTLTIIP